MKSLTILFLVIVFNCAYGQSFAPVNSSWHTYYYWIGTNGPGQQYTSHNHIYSEIIGDTIIQLDTFKIVKTEKLFGQPNIHSNEFNGYFYTDSNKVYYGSEIDSMSLIYDFAMDVGDSIIKNVGYGTYWGTDTVKVISVADTILDGIVRKKIIFEDFTYYSNQFNGLLTSDGMVWVEGIGDIRYGMDLSGYGYNFIANWSLECFKEAEIAVFGTCEASNTNIIEQETFDVRLYPNPTTNSFNILGLENSFYKVDIYTITGKLIFSKELYSNQELSIELPSAGIYNVVISSDLSRVCRKIIKY